MNKYCGAKVYWDWKQEKFLPVSTLPIEESKEKIVINGYDPTAKKAVLIDEEE